MLNNNIIFLNKLFYHNNKSTEFYFLFDYKIVCLF